MKRGKLKSGEPFPGDIFFNSKLSKQNPFEVLHLVGK